MGHREDLLAGAVRCLREKGYARTTARDIVAASGTNLASIGYHYGSTQALLNAAVFQAMADFGTEIEQVLRADASRGGSALERIERFWAHVIDSFRANPELWLATFDVFGVAQRDPEIRAVVAQGLDDGRALWARALYGLDADRDDQGVARAIGSLHQALFSGVLTQWLIDPDRAPSASDLAAALKAISRQLRVPSAGGTPREILEGMRVGIAHHLGWAVAVTASAEHEVVDRRRIELIEPGMPTAPIEHEAKPLGDDAAARMVAEARASALRATSASLDKLAASLPGPIVSMSLRAWPLDFPDDIAVLRRPAYDSRADSVMYCQVLSECAHVRGWEVHLFDAKDVEAQAATILGERADDVLRRPRATLGPPWTRDHRIALASTIVAS